MKDLAAAKMDYTDLGMSNFDHLVDDGFAEILKKNEGKMWGNHTAWNFCGDVWYENGKFHEQVNVYHVLKGEYEAETLEELMEVVNNIYGWD